MRIHRTALGVVPPRFPYGAFTIIPKDIVMNINTRAVRVRTITVILVLPTKGMNLLPHLSVFLLVLLVEVGVKYVAGDVVEDSVGEVYHCDCG